MIRSQYQSIADMLFGLAHSHSNKLALINEQGRGLAYSQLPQIAHYLKGQLEDRGIDHRSRVALMLPPGITMAATSLGLMSSVTLIPLNPESTEEELDYLFKKHRIELLVTSNTFKVNSALLDRHNAQRLNLAADYLWDVPSFNTAASWTLSGDYPAVILHTSGSTARPKSVLLTHQQLLCSAQNLCHSLQLTEQDTCLSVMPPFHVCAIVDLLIGPLLCGGSVVVATNASGATFWRLNQMFHPTWYQGVPTMLQAIVDGADQYLPNSALSLRFIRSVSAHLSQPLERALKATFNLPIIQIYGMTEAAGVITSNTLSCQKEGSVGVPVGPEIQVINNGTATATPYVIGEIYIRGDTVIQAYDEGNDINQHNFANGWFKTGDQGYVDEDGYFFLTGRTKELINQGGEKIAPLEIDQCALKYPGVKDAACFALPHETLGEEVALAIVPAEQNFDIDALRQHLKQQLSDYKCPRKIYQLEQLPITKGGKLQRFALPDLTQAQSGTPLPQKTRPATAMGKAIQNEWRQVLKLKEIYNEDDFFDLGGDSLSAATLMTALEKRLGTTLPTFELIDYPVLSHFISRMEQLRLDDRFNPPTSNTNLGSQLEYAIQKVIESWSGQRQQSDSLITGFNTEGTLSPLFWCCQGRDELYSLLDNMSNHQPLYAMRSLSQLVKRHRRDNQALAARYVAEILELQPDGPYLVGGFSEGARVAHYIAEELERHGKTVKLLVILDTIIDHPYHGNVAAFHCVTGKHSPFGVFNRPVQGMSYLYQGDVALYQYDWLHSKCMNTPYVSTFVEQLEYELDCARQGKLSKKAYPMPFNGNQDAAIYAKQLAVDTPRLMQANTLYRVTVTLRNISEHIWLPTQTTGVIIAARWLNLKHQLKTSRCGFAELTQSLSPNQDVTLNLELQSPESTGLRWLEIDLLEEARGWLTIDQKPSYRKLVWVRK